MFSFSVSCSGALTVDTAPPHCEDSIGANKTDAAKDDLRRFKCPMQGINTKPEAIQSKIH